MPFHIVDDVLMEILDSAYQNDQRLPDYQLLCAFSLVSKAWTYEAQKRLFSEGLSAAIYSTPSLQTRPTNRYVTVYLPRPKHFRLFARSVDPSQPRGAYLGSLVIKLRVAPSSGVDQVREIKNYF